MTRTKRGHPAACPANAWPGTRAARRGQWPPWGRAPTPLPPPGRAPPRRPARAVAWDASIPLVGDAGTGRRRAAELGAAGAALPKKKATDALPTTTTLAPPPPQDLSIHTPRRGSSDTSAGTTGAPLPPLPGTPHALRACKKLRPSLDFEPGGGGGGGGRPPHHPHAHHPPRSSVDWVAAAAAASAASTPSCTPSPPVPLSLPSVSLAGLLPDQVEYAIGAAKRAAPGGRGPLGLRLDTAALVRDLNAARGAAAAAVAGRRFSACF